MSVPGERRRVCVTRGRGASQGVSDSWPGLFKNDVHKRTDNGRTVSPVPTFHRKALSKMTGTLDFVGGREKTR